jgi:HK97 family phage portal protein
MPQSTLLNDLAYETRQTQAFKSWVLLPPGTQVFPRFNWRELANKGYMENPDIFACISLLQKTCAGIDLHLYSLDDDKEIDKHPLINLIRRPNPEQSYQAWMEDIVGDFFYSGNCFIEKVGPYKNKTSQPRELWTLPPYRMHVIRGDYRERVSGYMYMQDVSFNAYEVLHLKKYHPLDDFYGLSPIQACAINADANNAAAKWNYELVKNSGRPSGIVSVNEESMDENTFQELQDRMRQAYSGEQNAGRIVTTTGDLQWKQITMNPMDMDFHNMYLLNTRKICSAFGVPPQLIAEETAKTYSNFKESREGFYKETVLPLLDYLLGEFNHWLVPLFGGGVYLNYDTTEIEAIAEDTTDTYDRALRALAGGAATVNETREILGLKNLGPEADERLIPLNLTPESLAGEAARLKSGLGPTPQYGEPGNTQPGLPPAPNGRPLMGASENPAGNVPKPNSQKTQDPNNPPRRRK